MHDVIILDGGLGNNLFQLHYAWSLKQQRSSTRVELQLSHSRPSNEQIFVETIANELGLEISAGAVAARKMALSAANAKRALSEKRLMTHKRLDLTITQLPNCRLHCGYWQSIPFVAPTRNRFDDTISALLDDGHNDTPIVHVRGGDYITPTNERIYETLDIGYYRKAFDEVEKSRKNTTYDVVTNDQAHVERMLSSEQRAFDLRSGTSAIDDFSELSRHKVIVATNSTYCWWAARIGLYKGQTELVIAPRHWLKEEYRHRSHPDYGDNSEQVVLKI